MDYKNEVQKIVDYQQTIIKNNRVILEKLTPVLNSHRKLRQSLGMQIGTAKTTIKILTQQTFDFDEKSLFE